MAGELYASPRSALPHAVVSSVLGADLGGPFQRGRGGPGGWWILFEPEIHLGEDVVVPDLAGWRRERVPLAPRGAAMDLPPDWVCEVLSPGTARLDRAEKSRVYAREGVGWLWFVDPAARVLEAWRLERGRWVQVAVHAGEARARVEPFDAVELELAALWGEDGATG